MTHAQPIHVLPWLISRASGVVALMLISLSVMLGLAMAAKVLRRPGIKRAAMKLHEHVALLALVAIAVHGLALLGDTWLAPGWRGIAVPFALGYRPAFTGIGIIGGYLAALLGPTFYLRRRLGVRRWRTIHRATILVWGLSAVHALGAGSDGTQPWLRAIVILPGIPIVYLLVARTFASKPRVVVSAHTGSAHSSDALARRRRLMSTLVSLPEIVQVKLSTGHQAGPPRPMDVRARRR